MVHPLQGQALADAVDYNSRKAPQPADIPQAARDAHNGLSKSPTGSACDREEFAQSTWDVQVELALPADGKYGPATTSAVDEAYADWELFDVKKAKRNMIFLDFYIPAFKGIEAWAAQIARLKCTDATLGVNQVQPVHGEESDPFLLIYSPDRIEAACAALQAHGMRTHLMVWLSPGEDFIRDMFDVLSPIMTSTDSTSMMLDCEGPWVNSDLPLVERAGLIATLHEGQSYQLTSSALYFAHRNARPLIEVCTDGCVVQCYAFRDPNNPGTMKDNYLPGILQVRTADFWDAYYAWKILGIPLWHGQATYKQNYEGVSPDQSMRASACTSLGLGIKRIAWWSWGNIKTKNLEQRTVASFSPDR